MLSGVWHALQTWDLGTLLDANFLSQLPECPRSIVGEVCVSKTGSFHGAGGGGIGSSRFVVGVGDGFVFSCCVAGGGGLLCFVGIGAGFFLIVVGGSGASVVCAQAVELDDDEDPGVTAVSFPWLCAFPLPAYPVLSFAGPLPGGGLPWELPFFPPPLSVAVRRRVVLVLIPR